jgi:hypothetical protein
MKLLRNEAQYRRWATVFTQNAQGAGWDTYRSRWRNEAPTQYPCYSYAVTQSFGDEEERPCYLYLSDVEEMQRHLLEHSPARESAGDEERCAFAYEMVRLFPNSPGKVDARVREWDEARRQPKETV